MWYRSVLPVLFVCLVLTILSRYSLESIDQLSQRVLSKFSLAKSQFTRFHQESVKSKVAYSNGGTASGDGRGGGL